MAPRSNWKGYLKLSLVSCSVALYSATSTSQRVRFNIINRNTGNRVHNQVIDAETEEPVEQEDRVKGYQVEKGRYVLVEDEELDDVALESTHTIEIESFIPRDEVDELTRECLVTPYDRELLRCVGETGRVRACKNRFDLRRTARSERRRPVTN